MGADESDRKPARILPWVVALVVTAAAFYLLDHAVMGLQDLPLDWHLSPAQ